MYHLFPRELSVGGGRPSGDDTSVRLRVAPVAEIASHLRAACLVRARPLSAAAPVVLAQGSELDVEVNCSLRGGAALPTSGRVAVEVLADRTAPAAAAVAAAAAGWAPPSALVVGYDFGRERLFVDHARLGSPGLVQTAPLPRAHLRRALLRTPASVPPPPPLLRVLLDRAMIETFGGGEVAITSFVTPTGAAAPGERVVRDATLLPGRVPAELACSASVWSLAL